MYIGTGRILIAAAVIPAVWLLIKVYRADRLEREPPALVASLVFLGVISTAVASLAEELGMRLLGLFFTSETVLYDALLFFAVVGAAEEGAKYLLLRYRTWRSPHFNCQFDGVVYAVSVSLGFALWENIRYVLTFGLGTAAIRAVTAVPGHACFGVFMGVWYGAAKRCELAGDPARARADRLRCVAIPALIHGSYDFIASLTTQAGSLVFIAFVAVMFLAALRTVRRASANDRYFF